jgi:alkanesulfonate monooxygenase SsuD/methylene tetrahydromethanopterin reductase-like flavin-dependent oxidoreductase (luciferase family)
MLAKQCATIDVLSQGRLLPAFGIGSPLGPEWSPQHRHAHPRQVTDEALEIIARLRREDSVDFAGTHYRPDRLDFARCRSSRPAVWIGGGSEAAIRRTARYGTGWQAGGETPAEAGKIVAAIKRATAEAGRSIDDDHYGAGFPFYFGSPSDSVVPGAMAAYAKRTGRNPQGYFAIGDERAIFGRIGEYVDAGVAKFILRPIGEDIIGQTRRLIEKVLPLVDARWPKMAKAV